MTSLRSLRRLTALAIFTLFCPLGALAADERPPLPEPHPDLPPEFRQLLPRGGIPSIDEPTFVDGAGADVPGDAWVLGVAVDGGARAYSLNLLNRYEIVNDKIGETAFAAVW